MEEIKKDNMQRFVHATDKLKQIFLENPDMPILIIVSDTANDGDYSFECVSDIGIDKAQYLDCDIESDSNDGVVITDKDDLEEHLDRYWVDRFEGSDKEFFEFIEQKVKEYEPHLKDCIKITIY